MGMGPINLMWDLMNDDETALTLVVLALRTNADGRLCGYRAAIYRPAGRRRKISSRGRPRACMCAFPAPESRNFLYCWLWVASSHTPKLQAACSFMKVTAV